MIGFHLHVHRQQALFHRSDVLLWPVGTFLPPAEALLSRAIKGQRKGMYIDSYFIMLGAINGCGQLLEIILPFFPGTIPKLYGMPRTMVIAGKAG